MSAPPTPDAWQALRVEDEPSAWTAYRWALGLLTGAELEEVERRAAASPQYRARLEAEKQAQAAGETAVLPASVRLAAQPAAGSWGPRRWSPRHWGQWLAWPTAAFASAAALWLAFRPATTSVPAPSPASEGRVRWKGGGVSAVLLRSDGSMLGEMPWEQLPPLDAGDRLRLHVLAPPGAFLVLQGMQEGAWDDLHRGALPADGWLPLSVRITDEGEAQLRLWRCDGATDGPPEQHGCALQSLAWR